MRSCFNRALVALCVAAGLLTCASCGSRRPGVDDATLVQHRIEYAAEADRAHEQSVLRVIRRLKARLDAFERGESDGAPVLHVLIISGGGDFGAFGAGFLQGWGSVTDPAWKRPQFDIVT